MIEIEKEALSVKEKKVEYIELIYDLIFVYIIGRNNLLLHNFENGFVALAAFMAYVMTTLAVIQIWNYTTYYINIYGRHSVREHIFLFINMFLMYFIGEGTRADWQNYHMQYHAAWALILVNTGIQYLFELKNFKAGTKNRKQILKMAAILFTEALIVAADIPVYRVTQEAGLSLVAILFGMFSVFMFGQKSSEEFLDFPHLSERAMLYVVFTFGEMIIGISSYFEGEFSLNGTYFAFMAFLIVVGLFLSYGVFYDRIINREKKTNGVSYILLHIFIIFALNNITSGLEFMREEKLLLLHKMLFLVGSLLLFFGFLFLLGSNYAKAKCQKFSRLWLSISVISAVFAALMIILRTNMTVNIALTVIFVFLIFGIIYNYGKNIQSDRKNTVRSEES